MAAQIFWENPCSLNSQAADRCSLVVLHQAAQGLPKPSDAAGGAGKQSEILHSNAER